MAYAVRFEVTVYVEEDEEPTKDYVRKTQEIISTTLCGYTHDMHGTPVDLGHANVFSLEVRNLDE